ncbi:MAG: pyruvate formate lyase-activating protein, partial [Candidatus Wukongarchaeota archaeon]|nr:pyruvate formate lyase-activating protein [Candidatus Wukongarchaeota archaeon]
HVECCTKPILEWVAENCPKALVNIMGQYRPEFIVARTKDYPEIKRRPSSKEMRKAQKTADDLGILWEPVS